MKWPQPWQVGSYFTAPPNQFKHDPGERTRHACGLLDDPSWIEIMTIVLIHSFIDSSFTHVCNTLWSHSFLTPLVPSSPLPPPGPHVPFISLFCCLCLLCDSLGLPRAHCVGTGGELSTRGDISPMATPWTQ